MSHAVIGMFDNTAAANKAQSRLLSMGIPAGDIRLSTEGDAASTTPAGEVATPHQRGFWDSVKDMFGADESADANNHLGAYAEGERRGGAVLRVDAEESQADQVVELLQSAGAVDVDAMASSWRNSGWTGNNTTTATKSTAADTKPVAAEPIDTYDTGAATAGMTTKADTDGGAIGYTAPGIATGGAATNSSRIAESDAAGKIDLVKEDLAVGKRVVNRGGVRIIKKVIERPVEQSVNLREEHVSVDRHAVDRPLSGTDANDAFKDQTIEVTESAEQVVAAKTARVIGEVIVGKTASERTEKVTDTLRETDVEVQQLPGETDTFATKSVEDNGSIGSARSAKTNV